MKFVIATNNAHKLVEMRQILGSLGFEVIGLGEAGFFGEIEETGTTFEENAIIKAETVCRSTGLAAIADDSGLEVDGLGGAPGVYSARYGGESCKDDVERYELLLKNMETVEERSARYACCIACVFPNGERLTAHGYCDGEILREPRGEGGFGYDPVFFMPQFGRTMAEITADEKNSCSHRAIAIDGIVKKLKERESE